MSCIPNHTVWCLECQWQVQPTAYHGVYYAAPCKFWCAAHHTGHLIPEQKVNLGSTQRWVLSLTPHLLYPWWKSSFLPMGSSCGQDILGMGKISHHCQELNPRLSSPQHNHFSKYAYPTLCILRHNYKKRHDMSTLKKERPACCVR